MGMGRTGCRNFGGGRTNDAKPGRVLRLSRQAQINGGTSAILPGREGGKIWIAAPQKNLDLLSDCNKFVTKFNSSARDGETYARMLLDGDL